MKKIFQITTLVAGIGLVVFCGSFPNLSYGGDEALSPADFHGTYRFISQNIIVGKGPYFCPVEFRFTAEDVGSVSGCDLRYWWRSIDRDPWEFNASTDSYCGFNRKRVVVETSREFYTGTVVKTSREVVITPKAMVRTEKDRVSLFGFLPSFVRRVRVMTYTPTNDSHLVSRYERRSETGEVTDLVECLYFRQ